MKAIQPGGGHSEQASNQVDLRQTPEDDSRPEVKKKRTLADMKGMISAEEVETYKKSKTVADDPMAKFLGRDQLVA